MIMNWLQRLAQSAAGPKPMALPYDFPDNYNAGVTFIDHAMSPETAENEKKVRNPQFLNAGGCGIVNRLSDGTIYKYTEDADEANIARFQMKNNVSCMPRVFSVDDLQGKPRALWGIHREDIVPLAEDEKRAFERLSDNSYPPQSVGIDYNKRSLYKIKWLRTNNSVLANEFADILECLINNNIHAYDLHGGNVGRTQDGRLVAHDLGQSIFKS